MCARAVPDPAVAEQDLKALVAAETWVRRPDEANRRAAMAAAEATKMQTPEAWAAVGAFWSGGSMSPDTRPLPPRMRRVATDGSSLPASSFHSSAYAGR